MRSVLSPGGDHDPGRDHDMARLQKERARYAGKALAKLREDQGLSQAQVATFLGKSPRDVAEVERGMFSGKPEDLQEVVRTFEEAIIAAAKQR